MRHSEVKEAGYDDPKNYQKLAEKRLGTFCAQTTMHGMAFLIEENNPYLMKRIIWVAIVLSAYGSIIIFLQQALKEFLAGTPLTTIELPQSGLSEVIFPSVTLCNYNKRRASMKDAVGDTLNFTAWKDIHKYLYLGSADDFDIATVRKLQNIFTKDEVVKSGILFKMMREELSSLSDIMAVKVSKRAILREKNSIRAKYGWHFKTLGQLQPGNSQVLGACYERVWKDGLNTTEFLPFFGTDSGSCIVVTPQIMTNSSYDNKPWKEKVLRWEESDAGTGSHAGRDMGLTIIVDAEVYDYDYNPYLREGFEMSVHHPKDKPIMGLAAFHVGTGLSTEIHMTPTITVGKKNLKKFKEASRMCHFDDEMNFSHLDEKRYRYSLSNCKMENAYQLVESNCNCTPFSKDLTHSNLKTHHPCVGSSLKCQHDAMLLLRNFSETHHASRTMKCMDPCNNDFYSLSVTKSKAFDYAKFKTYLKITCPLIRKLTILCKGDTPQQQILTSKYPDLCKSIVKPIPEDAKYIENCYEFDGAQDQRIGNKGTCLLTGHSSKLVYDKGRLDRSNLYGNDEHQRHDRAPTVEKRIALERMKRICPRRTMLCGLYMYTIDNLSVVNVFFSSLKTVKFINDENMSMIIFLATVGGILGLCDGISMITLMETTHALTESFLFYALQLKRSLAERKIRTEAVSDVQKFRYNLAKRMNNL